MIAHCGITWWAPLSGLDGVRNDSSPSPPRFFRAPLLTSCATLVSPSLAVSPSGSIWASWFSLLSPPSWLLSDFLSRLLSFSLREEGGFFPLLLRTFCCCCRRTDAAQLARCFSAPSSEQQAEIPSQASEKWANVSDTQKYLFKYIFNHLA